ncbi:MAG: hypothetical protein ACRENG_01665 [bacterium]
MARLARAIAEFFMLTQEQRHVIGEKVLEMGNIGAGALIFGSALSEGRITWFYVFAGLLFWIVMFCIYLHLTKSRGKKDD